MFLREDSYHVGVDAAPEQKGGAGVEGRALLAVFPTDAVHLGIFIFV